LALLGISFPFFLDDLNHYYKDISSLYLEMFVMSLARIDRYISLRIKRLKDLSTYRGNRHSLNLPVHGQRTRTNANTQRSKRRKLEELNKLNARIK
jgi:small subunit ribosomal protein S13